MQNGVPKDRIYGVYLSSMLTQKVQLHITEVGNRVKENLEIKLRQKIGNKCIEEGYVSPNRIEILQYSAGEVVSERIAFHVAFTCWISHPVEGMILECTVKTVTKAGIHAQVIDQDGNIPITVFVARDHNHLDPTFTGIKIEDLIKVEVIGIRYELNDPYICVIANLYHGHYQHTKTKPQIARKTMRGGEDAMDKLYMEHV